MAGRNESRTLDAWELQELERDERFARLAVNAFRPELTKVFERAASMLVAAPAPTHTRAVADPTRDTGTEEVMAAILGAARGLPIPAWPLIAGLAASCPGVRVIPAGSSVYGPDGGLYLVDPTSPLLDADDQALEKGAIAVTQVEVPLATTADVVTTALYTDLSYQADAARAEVDQIMRAAVMAKVDGEWTAALAAAAGTPASDLAAAVGAVAGAWGPQVVIITSIGTQELAASGIPVIVDPTAGGTFVVATNGVTGLINGPGDVSAIEPKRLGRGIGHYVFHVLPTFGTGAVAAA